MKPNIVHGDLLDQDVDVIVNAWNRNFIPWWLLLPQGVSKAIRRRAGTQPFRDVARAGLLPVGGAVLTSAGRLPYRGIIHVAGINAFWVATETSIRRSVCNALDLAAKEGFQSIAFPLIGGGTGGQKQQKVLAMMVAEIEGHSYQGAVTVVIYGQPM
jgi:O-acetyl-ADP-ribose deacetylase (regulator of RNase III)